MFYAGVMSARGILRNPAMYAGYDDTPFQCIQDWVRLFTFSLFSPVCVYTVYACLKDNLHEMEEGSTFMSFICFNNC